MTGRERFRETLGRSGADRVPYLEEGLRDDVLDRWHGQGLPRDADLAEMFHMDRRERIPLGLEPRPPMEGPPRSRRDLRVLHDRLNAADPGRLPEDWHARVAAWRNRDHILELPVHRGFFLTMGVEDWSRFLDVMYLFGDAPTLLREIMELHGRFTARLVERVLPEVEIDFASFSEPIGSNHGPLLSPKQYREYVLESYLPVIDVLRRHGVETICLITYANARALLPSILDAGFNCLWACEADVRTMDYRDLRREFGRQLRLIGGIDLDVLLLDRTAIRTEIMSKVPPLLAEGGYIPLADGRVRANVPLENYVYYRRLLEEVTQA